MLLLISVGMAIPGQIETPSTGKLALKVKGVTIVLS